MICRQVTLSGDPEWPKVADAVIEARASLSAVAVMAFASPRRAAIRRKHAPSALLLRCKFFAANRNACAARFTPGRVVLDCTLPPDFLGFGASPSQLPKCFSRGHR